ncbi:MAG: S8 family serine peptidase [Acidobacteria bacterium]|nr:S8 family serine peptidase [Acidobacteriota bacterium]
MNLRFLLAVTLSCVAALAQDVVPGRFIVELSGAPALGHRSPDLRRSEIAAQHRSLERLLQNRQFRVLARVDTVANALVVQAPDAASLAILPGVLRVVPVRALRPMLYRALVNHEVAPAWDLAGGIASAGAGMKVAILDTGITPSHPGFQPPEGFTAPEGFPKANSDANLALTNAKVIVARSFDSGSVQDRDGHGTAVAMCAAGVRHESPRGTLSGVAPAAWIGAYRVSNLADGLFYTDVVLQALDWAAKDGMDVINLSFGSVGAFGAENDTIFLNGLRRLLDNGVVVINSAGNTPGPSTVDDTASAEPVIAVGSNNSTPSASTAVVPSVGQPFSAAASSNVTSLDPMMAPMVDAETLGNARGCQPFEPGSLTGRFPLIERGDCFFYEKLANAATGGAVAAVIFNSASPSSGTPDDLITMSVEDNPTIPGLFIGNTDGQKLKTLIQTVEDLQVQLRFPNPSAKPNSVSSFSSRGPAMDLRIKPDLVATGNPVYTAAIPASSSTCDICDPSGYISVAGTSFSAPITAGAAAVLKAARPGLSLDNYRSLLINSAAPLKLSTGAVAPIMSAGAGILNLKNAVASTLAVSPVSLSFQSGSGTIDSQRPLTFKNLSSEPAEYQLSVESASDSKPVLDTTLLQLEPGAQQTVQLTFSSAGLAPGGYEGFVKAVQSSTSAETRIPYWYAVEGSPAGGIAVLRSTPANPLPGATLSVYVRIHDKAGLVLSQPTPVVNPVSGGGQVVSVVSGNRTYPNSWLIAYQTGPIAGPNVFTVRVGDESFNLQVTTGN